jgi:hypothetical protein
VGGGGGKNGKQGDGWNGRKWLVEKQTLKESHPTLTAAHFGRELMEEEKFDDVAKSVELKKIFMAC